MPERVSTVGLVPPRKLVFAGRFWSAVWYPKGTTSKDSSGVTA